MTSSFGWAGSVLFVDLTNQRADRVPTAKYKPEHFLGGLGLNTKIFWDLGCPNVGAFHPQNPLIISAGPLTGTYGGFGKGIVCAISSQSYPIELFSYSAFGGRFPAELKFAGYDAIVIQGKSEVPIYLSIRNETISFNSADDIWGLTTHETQRILYAKEEGSSVLTIGPAGENLSRIGVIFSEISSAAGQGGFGAVMGSKNLKAITVKGTGTIKFARPGEVMQLTQLIREENTQRVEKKVKLWRVPYTSSKDIQELFKEKYYLKQSGCYACPTQCVSVNYVPGIGLAGGKCADWQWSPMFSSAPKDIWEANILTQNLGINMFDIVCGIPILLQLAYRDNLISTKEIEEIMHLPATTWLGGRATDHEFLSIFLFKIASGEIPYSQGTPRFIDYFEKQLQCGKELVDLQREIYPARGYAYHNVDNLGSALHWATDTRDPIGSSHEYRDTPPDVMEHFGLPPYSSYQISDLNKTVYDGAELVTAWIQDNQSLKNSLTVCQNWSFMQNFYDPPDNDLRIFESRYFSAVTGVDMTVNDLAMAGERIWNLRRAVMVKRENRTRADDTINPSYFKKTFKAHGGVGRGNVNGPIDYAKFEILKDRYYKLRKWDVDTGIPSRNGLEKLDLKDVADTLFL